MLLFKPPVRIAVGRFLSGRSRFPASRRTALYEPYQARRRDQWSQLRMPFEQAGNVGKVFLALAHSASGIFAGPNLSLEYVAKRCHGQREAQDLKNPPGAPDERRIARVVGTRTSMSLRTRQTFFSSCVRTIP